MRALINILTFAVALTACATSIGAQQVTTNMSQVQSPHYALQIYHVQTKYLQNITPQGGYMQVSFSNQSERKLVDVSFMIVPYANGEPILRAVSDPVVFDAKGEFEPGKHYTVISSKPVWPANWRHPVNCVHVVGLVLQYADGKSEKIDHSQIANYLSRDIAPQNCSQPNRVQSRPGPY